MKVNFRLVYPSVSNGIHSSPQRTIEGHLNIGCGGTWKTNTAMRHGFCELIFAGAGNHPGNEQDQMNGFEFDSGDRGINNVHRQWARAKVRSMSVGDLINLDPDGMNEWWICNSIGFVLLTAEQTQAWLSYPRAYGCCSFELNKWMESHFHTCKESPKQHCRACTQERYEQLLVKLDIGD
jgi:hypothetical protein